MRGQPNDTLTGICFSYANRVQTKRSQVFGHTDSLLDQQPHVQDLTSSWYGFILVHLDRERTLAFECSTPLCNSDQFELQRQVSRRPETPLDTNDTEDGLHAFPQTIRLLIPEPFKTTSTYLEVACT
ncbi:hypothetical protein H9L39_03748 [Fusarium oxysporum f. sp. albedinis]|nr:hypothetical protein H9L39_03748 [Fusarium oxysporum f. sp. albedinis]